MTSRRRDREPDALASLERDHRRVEGLFRRIERGGGNRRARVATVREIVAELGLHAAIEEQVLYPVARSLVPALRPVVLESLEAHHIVKRTLAELGGLDPGDEHLAAKVAVLREIVRLHVEREERDLLPRLRRALGAVDLEQVAVQLERARAAYGPRARRRKAAAPSARTRRRAA